MTITTTVTKNSGLSARLESLREKHEKLDTKILAAQNCVCPDSLEITEDKRRKLKCKEEILRIEEKISKLQEG